MILSLRLSQDPSCLTESKVGLAHRAPDSPHQWGPSRVLAASGNRAPELEVSAEPGGGGCSCHQPPNKEPWVPPQRAKGATHCRASNSETCHIWPKWSRKPSYAQTESLAGEGSPGCPHGGVLCHSQGRHVPWPNRTSDLVTPPETRARVLGLWPSFPGQALTTLREASTSEKRCPQRARQIFPEKGFLSVTSTSQASHSEGIRRRRISTGIREPPNANTGVPLGAHREGPYAAPPP